MAKSKNNNLLIHGLILVTILATAKSAEAEITMEAAFQGHCGHTSPCEQLCYEIHDGMYECDCIEGYELNKNGYSCQVINSTNSADGRSKSDEDVLYQKGASFSAKLGYAPSTSSMAGDTANGVEASAPISSASFSMEDVEGVEDDNFFYDDTKRNDQRTKVNSNDYYISSEDVYFSNGDEQELTNTSQDVPELKTKLTEPTTTRGAINSRRVVVTATTDDPLEVSANKKSIRIHLKAETKPTAILARNQKSTTSSASTTTTTQAINHNDNKKNKLMNQDSNDIDMDEPSFSGVAAKQPHLRTTSQSQSTYQDRNTAEAVDLYNKNNKSNNAKQSAAAGVSSKLSKLSNASVNSSASTNGHACDLDCGTEGVCERMDDTNKCLCPFGKSGESCLEEIKIRTPKFSKHSWLAFPALRGAYKHVQIRVEFRPESFDGIILLSGERDDLTGDFMALLLNKGFVEFWFDCGSGVGSVRSRETILLNEWNSVIIYRHRWDAWLVLNHGTKVQGRSNGLFSRITFREPVFLGGTGNITGLTKRLPVYNGFIGCIRRFVANEHEYKFEEHPLGDVNKGFDIQDCVTDKCFTYPCQHGGKCLPSDQGAVCLCPIGFVGDLCEIRMDLQVPAFNGSSFLRYAPLGDSALIWLELKVILKAEQPDGLILYSGSEKHGDFIALSLSVGFVEFVFDLGSGPAIVRSEYPLAIGQWHTVKVSRTARLAVLKVDTYPEVMTISSNGFWHLSLPENIFLGGVNHEDKLPLDLKSKAFFVGCIQKIDINGHSLSIISEALGGTNIGNCPHACVARPCGPLAECIPQMESYECRCNAFSTQCNMAAEVPIEELQKNKAKKKDNKEKYKINGKHTAHMTKHTKEGGHAKLHRSKVPMKSIKAPKTHHTTISPPLTERPASTSHRRMEHGSHHMETWEPLPLDEDVIEKTDDDIIYRDARRLDEQNYYNEAPLHSKHNKEKRKEKQATKESELWSTKPSDNSKVRGKDDHEHKSAYNFKLSRLPTHYESFQTNPEIDILTFDENVEVEIGVEQDKDYEQSQDVKQRNGNDNNNDIGSTRDIFKGDDIDSIPLAWKTDEQADDRRHAHDAMNEETKSEPFFVDDLLFDTKSDGNQDYHRKELVQDMRRILANGPENTSNNKALKLVVDEYDYENDDSSIEDPTKSNLDNKNSDNSTFSMSSEFDAEFSEVNDDILEPVQTVVEEKSTTFAQHKPSPTIDTQTDWSLLKKMKLPADHQSQFVGVRKNFGACFAGEDSYFHYNDAETMSQVISYNIDLNLRIKTHSPHGVILWTGRQGTTEEDADFLSLGIENGYLHFRYDLGSGEVDIKFNTSRVSDGLWHRVRAFRDSQAGYLEIDGRKTTTQYSPGKLKQLNTDTGLYVGGIPNTIYFTRRKYANGIVGCISEIVLAGELKLNFDPNTLGTAHNVETGLL
uniref:Pikachurin n=1 Tax=Zeugodacus cucurbitae TaxID=28588 RepID=A0A0A1XN49_ZEUCU